MRDERGHDATTSFQLGLHSRNRPGPSRDRYLAGNGHHRHRDVPSNNDETSPAPPARLGCHSRGSENVERGTRPESSTASMNYWEDPLGDPHKITADLRKI